MSKYAGLAGSRISHYEQWANLPEATYAVPSVIPSGTGTQALTADTAIISPFYLDRAIGLTEVGVVITTASSDKVVRIGLYTWDPETRTIGELVKDFGNVDAGSTGLAKIDTAFTVQPGWYAWAVISDSTPTLRTFLADSWWVSGALTVSSTNAAGVSWYTKASLTDVAESEDETAFPETIESLTAVTSTSDFRAGYLVLARFNNNPAP